MPKQRSPEEVAARKAKKEAKKQTTNQAKVSEAAAVAAVDPYEALAEARVKLKQGIRLATQLNPNKPGFSPSLKAVWKTLGKGPQTRLLAKDKAAPTKAVAEGEETVVPAVPIELPFPTDSKDHCETSPDAYGDIAPLLDLIAERLGKARETLRIWDPYYCAGSVTRHLGNLGFAKVRNECEDFYEVADGDKPAPKHHVLLTNPPYSEPLGTFDPHPQRLLRYAKESGKPFLLNMPEHCTEAAYWKKEFPDSKDAPLLLCPYKRYHFWTPSNARPEKNQKTHRRPDLGLRNSPFVSLWYVNLDPLIDRAELLALVKSGAVPGVDVAGSEAAEPSVPSRCRLCRKRSQLPEGRDRFKSIKDGAPSAKRKRSKE